jgi:hypothetical protein
MDVLSVHLKYSQETLVSASAYVNNDDTKWMREC